MSVAPVIVYLHGFASSPQSTKAGFFAERFHARGIVMRCPDFNLPDFRTLTMTRMLDQLEHEIERAGEPAVVMGSSLGGTLAILAAARMPSRIGRLILMAPAVMFAKAGHHLLPPDRIAEWRERGALPFFHYAHDEERVLDFGFYQDSLQHDAEHAMFRQPALIFQGRHDASVDPGSVETFARSRPNVTLHLLDDDHQLIASLPRMWSEIEGFLGLPQQ